MDKLTLIVSVVCPFARRARITIRQKNPEKTFKEELVDLQDKSQFFKDEYAKAIGRDPSNEGKVPVLIDGEVRLTESEQVVWYLSEKFQSEGNQLIPQDHVERFRMRLFIQNFSLKLPSIDFLFIAWNKKNEEERKQILKKQADYFEALNKEVKLPYALGEEFTLADVFIYPFFELWTGMEKHVNVPIDKKYEKVHEYIRNLQERPSIKENIRSADLYYQETAKFFKE